MDTKQEFNKINIKQALKVKNKLVGEIKELNEIINHNNSIEEGNPRRFDIMETWIKISELTEELVALKANIHRANAPVFEEIFAMAELKGQIKELKRLPTQEGKVTERYGSGLSVKEVAINAAEVRSMVRALENRIESIQNTLDVHNATTWLSIEGE